MLLFTHLLYKLRAGQGHKKCVFFVLIIMAKKSTVAFKTYIPNQVMLLPPSLDELIVKQHPVRIVNDVIDKINLNPLLQKI